MRRAAVGVYDPAVTDAVTSSPTATLEPETSPDAKLCPGCRRPVAGRFCSACGESPAAAEERSLGRFLLGWLDATTSLDGRFLGSFVALLRRPGLLTADYLMGVRRRRLSPMQTVLFANLIFFIAQSAADVAVLNTGFDSHIKSQIYSPLAARLAREEIARRGIPVEEFARRFDLRADEASRTLVLLLVPLFAVVFALLRLPGRRSAVEHLAFAAEFVAFATVYLLCGLFGFYAAMVEASRRGLPDAWTAACFAALPFLLFGIVATWLVAAFRRLYGDRLWPAFFRAGLSCLCAIAPLTAYRFVLFQVALKTA